MNTALFMLRCLQVGLRIDDLDKLDYGTAIDIITESANDNYDYKYKATQRDFDNF